MNVCIKDENGNVIQDTFANNEPLSYIHGLNQFLPGIEEVLENQSAGHEFEIELTPEKAFGQRHPENIKTVPKEMFAQIDNLQEGLVLQSVENGQQVLFTVAKIEDEMVTIDANHPLAGKSLNINGSVLEVREPSADELKATQPNA